MADNKILFNPKKIDKQETLFELPQDWQSEWVDMPEYNNWTEAEPKIIAKFKFRNEDDFLKFKNIVSKYCYDGQKVFDGEQSLTSKQAWYPHNEQPRFWKYTTPQQIQPLYPIYIISKGRYTNNPTSKILDKMQVAYKIVVEKQEFEKYAEIIPEDKILILPEKYKKEYDTFWENKDGITGSGASRNFVWDHSIENNHSKHWILDDNIIGFRRANNNMQVRCDNGFIFRLAEKFVDRYENVALSGFHYDKFVTTCKAHPPYTLNTRIYSCILINNNIPFRWRGKYNEDTDLALRVLKKGYCTILFNAFLQEKLTTKKMKGGNTEELYAKGTQEKSQMLKEMHPDLVQLSNKFNRDHHHVNYKLFKNNRLIKKKHLNFKDEVQINNIKLVRNK